MSVTTLPSAATAVQAEGGRVPWSAWFALILVFVAVYVGSLSAPGLLDDADATHAEAAREMSVTNDFVTLHVNGNRYLEKPPLPYWLVAVSYKIFGQNEFATRLPIALGVLGLALLAVFWGTEAFGLRAGIYAGLFTLTCTGVYLFTRILIPDVYLALFIALALYFFLSALELPSASGARWYLGYASLALAVLAKGLVALVFAGGTIVIYLTVSGDWKRWREFRIFTGVLLFLAIAAPWHILAGLRNVNSAGKHGFWWFYFINEHVLRFLGKRIPKDYNKMPQAAYWFAHLIWLFPWSLFLPVAVRRAWKSWKEFLYAERHDAGLTERSRIEHALHQVFTANFKAKTRLLCWIYAALILVFFAISTNQEYYTFPAYLPLILLLSAQMAAAEESTESDGVDYSRWILGGHYAFVGMGIAIAGVLFYGLWNSRSLPFVPDIGTVLAKRNVGNYTLSMSHFFDLTGESFAALRMPAIIAAVALLVGPLIALWLRRKRHNYESTWSIGFTMALFLIAAHLALIRFGSYMSSKLIAEQLQPQLRPADKMMIYGDQSYGSSLLFYLRRPIYLVNGATTSMYFGSTYPDAPKIFLNDEQLLNHWESGGRVFLFVPIEQRDRVREVLEHEPAYIVAESSEKWVLSNRR